MDASLTVVGSGIKSIAQLTVEAQTYIKKADVVLHLVTEPILVEWINANSQSAFSLNEFRRKDQLRKDSYAQMTAAILQELHHHKNVCVVVYGHPTVFAQPALDAVMLARKEGIPAKILPGISAEDCLFADLLINPGKNGCQSFETTEFLLYSKKFDTSCHLILWQVGAIGLLEQYRADFDNSKGLSILAEYLSHHYPPHHKLYLYEASIYPHLEPHITEFPLQDLTKITTSAISTLYVPPLANTAKRNESMAKKLGINLSDL